MDAHLIEGYDESTRNGTATFVQFGGRYYACTCRHMVEITQKRRESGRSKFATLALGYKQASSVSRSSPLRALTTPFGLFRLA
jgi:hypothetical protein